MKLGIDIGTSTVKLACIEGGRRTQTYIATHRGQPLPCIQSGIASLHLPPSFALGITGQGADCLLGGLPAILPVEEVPAIIEGARLLAPEGGSLFEIGSQNALFVHDLQADIPQFTTNEQCAGGTGSFFEDQMTRLGLEMSDFSSLVEKATSIPNLSGRCAVFAKTDIIHRQQEGVSKEDILKGLCYAMIRNFKATIVKRGRIKAPVVFCGGVTQNTGVVEAISAVFGLEDGQLIVPHDAVFAGALGAASLAEREIQLEDLERAFATTHGQVQQSAPLPKLILGDFPPPPTATGILPTEGCYLGVDIGSTSTNVVLLGADGTLVDFQYLRTQGRPEEVLRQGFASVAERYPCVKILGVGVTGSGRTRLGKLMGADAICDEITAQARGAVHYVPQVDTIFEIGGQDSKYIALEKGQVVDFQMNKICAAGTGSFVEEQSLRMGIPIEHFGPMALEGKTPLHLGERCTVFMETAIASAIAGGAAQQDIGAGLCHAIVRNYLHKVVGNHKVGSTIVLQGGVAYNPGIVAAFQSAYGQRIHVNPVFPISGAVGVALLAKDAVGQKESTFYGLDFPHTLNTQRVSDEEIARNRAFYKRAGELALADYTPTIDPKKKTIGVPCTLIMFKFFPLVDAFFKNLGFNVILSSKSDEETVALSQQYASGETCYPVKLIYGHMMQLAQKKVDYIFLPAIHTIRHPHSHAAHNYSCPYMQMAAKMVYDTLNLKEQGIELLNPLFDLELGAKMMGKAMLGTAKKLGFPPPRALPGLVKGGMAVNKYTQGVEKLGEELLADIKDDEKVIVLITRNYGLSDPVLNMGIPEILSERGCKVITLGHLPGFSIDVSKDYPNMYWPFGDHLLSGAKLIANHPNLYAIYLTNHGCGPDSMVSHMFKEEMGDKPYLQIEVDEHFSSVGIITRIEAFLNSLKSHTPAPKPENFDIKNVRLRPANISSAPKSGARLYIPDMGHYTPHLVDYFRSQGCDAVAAPKFDHDILELGRAETNAKEYLPFPMLLGSSLSVASHDPEGALLLPMNYGADADGQYARGIRTVLDRLGHHSFGMVSPLLEEVPQKAQGFKELFSAILNGDGDYMAKREGTPIACVGDMFCLTSLNEGLLHRLEREGQPIMRMPLSEMLWFLWKENGTASQSLLAWMEGEMDQLGKTMGAKSPFSTNRAELFQIADCHLPAYAGGNGRYRYAKGVQMSRTAKAVFTMAPMYENTAVVLEHGALPEQYSAPVFPIGLDYTWGQSDEAKLKSFLYYCGKE